MPFFSDDQLAKLAQLAREADRATDLLGFVTRVLRFLRACRFQSARYYECASSRPENDELLILVVQDTPMVAVQPGYRIRFKSSTLGMADDRYAPAVGASSSTNQSWVADLGLSSSCRWVDVPVRVQDRLIGLIAADWRGEDTLTPSDTAILAMLGSLVASVAESTSSADADRVESAFTDALYKQSDSVEAALTIAAMQLVETMNFAVVAIFQRSRGGGHLRKILERVHTRIGLDVPFFDEDYRIGEYLTGIAWQREDVRHIVDFTAQVTNKGHEVEQKSFDRHTALLGDIRSVLYSKIESSEPRYLVRIMNCVESPLPIVAAQRKVVDRITKSIAGHLNDVIATRRLSSVIELARVASRNITKPSEVIAHARAALRSEGFDDLIIVARHRHQDIGAALIDLPAGYKVTTDEQIDWSHETFRHLLNGKVSASPLKTLFKDSAYPLFGWLADQGYYTLISKSIEVSQITLLVGLLLKEAVGAPFQNPGPTSQLIDLYGSIIGSSIEGFDSHVTVEGSRKFMGRIGHEVRAPALDSAQAAMFAVATAQRVIPHIQDPAAAKELETLLKTALETINRKSTEIDRMMNFAKLAALEEVGSVQFNFVKIDLGDLIRDTVSSLRSQNELVTVDKEGIERECVVTFSKSVSALGSVTADENFLRVIFSHLIRNAAKYSLPRYAGKSVELKVTGIPQSQMAIVQISNWGVGISEAEFEAIFRPHVRGRAHDRRKAIGGLGLGLYVSRLLARAHGGTVFCHHSSPTLSDAKRTAAFEGFETCFEVRLPRSGSVGVRAMDLGGEKPQ